jgi:hypothetical protein
MTTNVPVKVFYCYAHEDEGWRATLEKYLAILRRNGKITEWHDAQIGGGLNMQDEITKHLNEANLILLLISPDFIASDHCYDIEMMTAIKRHNEGLAKVVPIFLRGVMGWEETPFAGLRGFPDTKPITSWRKQNDAWLVVAKGIQACVNELLSPSSSVLPQLRMPTPPFPQPRWLRLLLTISLLIVLLTGVIAGSIFGFNKLSSGAQVTPPPSDYAGLTKTSSHTPIGLTVTPPSTPSQVPTASTARTIPTSTTVVVIQTITPKNTPVTPNQIPTPTPTTGATLTFDDLGGGSSIIRVYPSSYDTVYDGTYNNGDTALVVCSTTGRTVTSSPASGEEYRKSKEWYKLQIPAGQQPEYATAVYADVRGSVSQC